MYNAIEMLEQLERTRNEDGLSKRKLAVRLRLSQSYVSRLMAGKVPLSVQAKRKIREYLRTRKGLRSDSQQWAAVIAEAADRSPAFKVLIEAALRMMQNDV